MWRSFVLTSVLSFATFGATVDGRVVNARTGAGIPDVSVSLMQQQHLAYSTATDAQGYFQIEDVKVGTYTATYRVHTIFYLPSDLLPGSQTLQVTGVGPVHVETRLPLIGKLSGRILDPTGTPVPNASVILRMERHNLVLAHPFVTDGKGEYHIENLPFSSAWVLSATAPPSWKPPKSDDNHPMGWAQTFYPGVTDLASAARIVLPQSGELWHLDITLKAVPAYRIRGLLLDPRGEAVPNVSIILGGGLLLPHTVSTKDDGTFEFPSLTDGQWRLSADSYRDGVKLRGEQGVEVNGHDVDGIKLHLEAPVSIRGKVMVEIPDGMSPPSLPKVQIGPQPSGPNRDGEFTIDNLYPGSYSIRPGTAPGGYYLDSIRLGNSDAPGPAVQILSGEQPVTLSYKYGGGTVRGAVDACGGGTVALVPSDPGLRRPGLIRQITCGADGKFEILCVRPGQYYALALPSDEYFGPIDSVDNDLLQQSTLLTVVNNETIATDIRLIKR